MSSTVPARSANKRLKPLSNSKIVGGRVPDDAWKEKLSKTVDLRENGSKTYHGDVWSTQGEYIEGMIYLSRRSAPTVPKSKNEDSSSKKKSDTVDTLSASMDDHMHLSTADNEKMRAKKRCASALSALSWDKGFESQIVREGGLRALINLSGLKDTISQRVSLYVSAQ